MEIVGQVFKDVPQYLGETKDTVFLEIGSDRYERSTDFFSRLAERQDADFHTVDVNPDARRRLHHLKATWHIKWGSDWCREDLPRLGKKVSCVYLDNFDYIWNIRQRPSESDLEQRRWYAENTGTPMNNQTCQTEHLKQMLHILPHLTSDAVIACDDTYKWNDCWVGKCGPVVVFLLAHGFTIVQDIRSIKDVGVILKRNPFENVI